MGHRTRGSTGPSRSPCPTPRCGRAPLPRSTGCRTTRRARLAGCSCLKTRCERRPRAEKRADVAYSSRSWWASKTEGVVAPPAGPDDTLQPSQLYLGPRVRSREEHSSPHVGPLCTRACHAQTARSRGAQARRHPSIAWIEAKSCDASPAPRPRAGFWAAPAHWAERTHACCAHLASEGVHRQQGVGPASTPWF